jgi:hypothetical protein
VPAGFAAGWSKWGDGNLSDFASGGLSSIGGSVEGARTESFSPSIGRAPMLLLKMKRTPSAIRQITSQIVLGNLDPHVRATRRTFKKCPKFALDMVFARSLPGYPQPTKISRNRVGSREPVKIRADLLCRSACLRLFEMLVRVDLSFPSERGATRSAKATSPSHAPHLRRPRRLVSPDQRLRRRCR